MLAYLKSIKRKINLKNRIYERKRNIKMRKIYRKCNRNNTVVFCSFAGKQYSDNPRAISEMLKSMRQDIEIVWLINEPKPDMRIPEYVTTVPYDSQRAYEVLCQAKVWVYNHDVPYGTYKGKDQFYIQTWHGDRGFKRIRYDASEKMGSVNYKSIRMIEPKICDLCIAGSDEGEQKYHRAFHYYGEIQKSGMPRNDCLVNLDTEYVRRVRKWLGLEADEKILLYAPTFRDKENGNSKIPIDFKLLKEELERTTGSRWKVLIRAHSLSSELECVSKEYVTDVSGYRDMAELLMITDLFISDYSSAINDYAILKRPVFLYLYDLASYENNSRKLKNDVTHTGYPIAYNMQELLKLAENINHFDFTSICEKVLHTYGTNETGNSTEEVCRKIIEWIG